MRERDRETDRQTRQTDRQTRQTRQTDRQTDKTDRQTDKRLLVCKGLERQRGREKWPDLARSNAGWLIARRKTYNRLPSYSCTEKSLLVVVMIVRVAIMITVMRVFSLYVE